MVSTAAAEVDPLYNASHSENIVALWGGTNDIATGASAASVYANIQTFGNDRKPAGWKVAIVSVLPRGSDPTFETTRQSVNASLRADFNVATSNPNVWLPHADITYADVLIDAGGNASIGAPGSQNGPYYISDHVHLNDVGYAIMGSLTASGLMAIE